MLRKEKSLVVPRKLGDDKIVECAPQISKNKKITKRSFVGEQAEST